MPSISTNGNGASPSPSSSRGAWATLVTGEKYLPGIAVFAETLLRGSNNHQGSIYPLIAMVTEDVQEEALAALSSLGCQIRTVKKLHPGHSKGDKNMAFAHFGDVWTKLRAFELVDYDRIVMVDSDMLVKKNMDELFDMPLAKGHIKATFACTCNPSKNPNYPKEWTPENCAYTQQKHPEHTSEGLTISPDSPPTHHSLNSGLVVLRPSHSVMKDMERRIQNDAVIETYRFPDQDFLADYYRNLFDPLPYVYNALKKLRSTHPQLWRDEEIKNIHYILGKPWTQMLDTDDPDAETHQWWWNSYCLRPWPAVITKYVYQIDPAIVIKQGSKDNHAVGISQTHGSSGSNTSLYSSPTNSSKASIDTKELSGQDA